MIENEKTENQIDRETDLIFINEIRRLIKKNPDLDSEEIIKIIENNLVKFSMRIQRIYLKRKKMIN